MSSVLTTVDRGAREFVKRCKLLQKTSVIRVGILSDAPKRTRRGGRSKLSLVAVAALHEFGTKRIPKRSFIRGTVEQRATDIQKLQRAIAVRVLGGKISGAQGAAQFGAKMVGWIQTRMSIGIGPPNAASTIARKRSSKPLINTGQLRSAVTWKAGAK